MSTRIRLSDVDRERFGVPEWIMYDSDQLYLSEMEAFEEHGLLDGDGNLKLDGYRGQRAVVWMALRRAGVHTDLLSFDFDIGGAQVVSEAPAAGKDPAATSADSSPNTPRRSRTTATSRRATSKR